MPKKFTVTTGAEVQGKRLLKMSGANFVHNTATATDRPVAASDYFGASGAEIAAVSLNSELPIEITVAGAIAAGAEAYAAADGKVQALPAANGTYRKVGVMLDAGVEDGDIVQMLPVNDGETTVVNN